MFKKSSNYSEFGNYNNLPVPVKENFVQAQRYVVPSFGSIAGYSTLMHDKSDDTSCNGYFNMQNAYPGGGRCSGKFAQGMCR